MLLHCWKATFRASSKFQALHGPPPSQVMGSFSGMEGHHVASLLTSPMAEQLGSQAPSLPFSLRCYTGCGYLTGGTRRFYGNGGWWLPHRYDHQPSVLHLAQVPVSHPGHAAQSTSSPLRSTSLSHRCPGQELSPALKLPQVP